MHVQNMNPSLLPVSYSWSNVAVGRESEALASLIPLSDMMMVGGLVRQPGGTLLAHTEMLLDISGSRAVWGHLTLKVLPLQFSTVLPLFSSLFYVKSASEAITLYKRALLPTTPPPPFPAIFLFPSLSSMKSFHNPQKNPKKLVTSLSSRQSWFMHNSTCRDVLYFSSRRPQNEQLLMSVLATEAPQLCRWY